MVRSTGGCVQVLVVLGLLFLGVGGVSPANGQGVRIIFLHHSCGQNLIAQGGVREGLTALGYEFYDHGYNEEGLVLADGTSTGTNFDVPDDNTNPDGYAAIFAQPLHDPPDNTFSQLMQYDVIVFKSCFPVSNIGDDAQLEEYKSYYLSIHERMDQYPDKMFVIVTQPPEIPADSSLDAAARARAFANWLSSDEYLSGHANVFVYDFFGQLAGGDNYLRPEYRTDESDAHPNESANRTIGPLFVTFLDEAIRSFSGGAPRPPAQASPAPGAEEMPSPAGEVPLVMGQADTSLIDDFEGYEPGGGWEVWTDGGQTNIECTVDSGTAYSGGASLMVQHSIAPGGWAGCGRTFETSQNWAAGQGLSMWMRSENPGMAVAVTLHVGDPQEPTPFQKELTTPSGGAGDWALVQIPWGEFSKPDWQGESGVAEFDAAQVVGLSFDFSAGEASPPEGRLWVDDLALLVQGQVAPVPPAAGGEEPSGEGVGSICPCSGLALPLAGLGLIVWRRGRPLWATGG
ncbi:MAG TPA: carbohydrate binding domain-containing protein [Anaerolineae bacterium]|nr:carbohydrate binding domain-containing protein [Anaerolineae bacterium]